MWVYVILRIALWPFWPAIERTFARIRYSPAPLLEILLVLLEIVQKILLGFLIIIGLFAATQLYVKFSEWRESRQKPVVESETACQSYMNHGATYVLTGELSA